MGQYRQWLQCRETNRQLHAQIRRLEEQLVQLQTQIDYTQSEEMLADNTIMRALAMYAQYGPVASSAEQTTSEQQSARSLSPALQARDSFSVADTPAMRTVLPRSQDSKKASTIPTTPHSELALLPEDIGTFIDEHTQTGQQRPPAWWLQTIQQNTPGTPQPPSGATSGEQAEQAGMRTNRLVQRWVARWGKQLNQLQEPPEDHNL